ncbi:MAG TPA: hypothetical protein PKH95_00590 [Candidatus Magasanikbacteria bacterium]|nr:hypothetical protein [Candidatus Magasanikbacteria bacterium]
MVGITEKKIEDLDYQTLKKQDAEIDIKKCDCGGSAVLIGEFPNLKAEGGYETANFATMESSVEKALLRQKAKKLYYRCSNCGKVTPVKDSDDSTVCRVCLSKTTVKGQYYVCGKCGHTEPTDSIEMS